MTLSQVSIKKHVFNHVHTIALIRQLKKTTPVKQAGQKQLTNNTDYVNRNV